MLGKDYGYTGKGGVVVGVPAAEQWTTTTVQCHLSVCSCCFFWNTVILLSVACFFEFVRQDLLDDVEHL
jgi:hypothetical protein